MGERQPGAGREEPRAGVYSEECFVHFSAEEEKREEERREASLRGGVG